MTQKILIVDDEPNILILMEQALEALEDEGVELLTARNGEEALEIIKTEKPNLVFLDVMMPKMNGLKVCQIVK
ncbi:MAG: response regulator, partial [Nostoc sp.]